MKVFFCDPHSPWQRGSNENTNGLLRQYFPKNFDLRTTTRADLAAVARELNSRPRQSLNWMKPCEVFGWLLPRPHESVGSSPPLVRLLVKDDRLDVERLKHTGGRLARALVVAVHDERCAAERLGHRRSGNHFSGRRSLWRLVVDLQAGRG